MSYEMFHCGGYGDYHQQWRFPPPPGCVQLVPVQPKKPEKKKKQQVTLKVKMCCSKCEEIAREEIGEVPGVEEIQITDSKVVVIGKADSEQVLKKAKKVDRKAELKEEEKEEEEEEEPSTTWSTYPYNCFPPPYAPISFVTVPPMEQSGPYRPSQSYGPSSSSYYPPAPEYYYPHCPPWYPYYPWCPY